MNPLRGLDIKGSNFSTIIRPSQGQKFYWLSLAVKKHRSCFIILEKYILSLNLDRRR